MSELSESLSSVMPGRSADCQVFVIFSSQVMRLIVCSDSDERLLGDSSYLIFGSSIPAVLMRSFFSSPNTLASDTSKYSMKPRPSWKAKRSPMFWASNESLRYNLRCFCCLCKLKQTSLMSPISFCIARATGGTLSRNLSSSVTAVSLSVSDTTIPWSPSRMSSSVPVSPDSFSYCF